MTLLLPQAAGLNCPAGMRVVQIGETHIKRPNKPWVISQHSPFGFVFSVDLRSVGRGWPDSQLPFLRRQKT